MPYSVLNLVNYVAPAALVNAVLWRRSLLSQGVGEPGLRVRLHG